MSKTKCNESLVELFQPLLRQYDWVEVIAAAVEAATRNREDDDNQAAVDAESSMASAYCQASRSEAHIAELLNQPAWEV